MLIYVAGPYSAPTEEGRLANVEKAMRAGLFLISEGHIPVIPHLSHFFDVWVERETGERLEVDYYYKSDIEILKRCDGIYMVHGWEGSHGARRELEVAEKEALSVYYDAEGVGCCHCACCRNVRTMNEDKGHEHYDHLPCPLSNK